MRALTDACRRPSVERMSETLLPGMAWKIEVRDAERLGTHPSPYYADTDAERDWFLRTQMHRPVEDYVIEQVPDPLTPGMRAELAEHRERSLADLEARKHNG